MNLRFKVAGFEYNLPKYIIMDRSLSFSKNSDKMKRQQPSPQEIKEENKKIRRLRFMVDLTLSLIYQANMTREEALEHYTKVKNYALRLFPGKEDAFEIIYAPRFKRLIIEKYGAH